MYDTSVGQIVTLISKSKSCSQSIKVECVLAPIVDLVSFSHSWFGRYFYSNHYEGNSGVSGLSKNCDFFFTNLLSSCAKIEPKLKKL